MLSKILTAKAVVGGTAAAIIATSGLAAAEVLPGPAQQAADRAFEVVGFHRDARDDAAEEPTTTTSATVDSTTTTGAVVDGSTTSTVGGSTSTTVIHGLNGLCRAVTVSNAKGEAFDRLRAAAAAEGLTLDAYCAAHKDAPGADDPPEEDGDHHEDGDHGRESEGTSTSRAGRQDDDDDHEDDDDRRGASTTPTTRRPTTSTTASRGGEGSDSGKGSSGRGGDD